MTVRQTGTFKRCVKKMHQNEKKALDDVIRKIMVDPFIGETKKGDLAAVQVYKYKFKSQLYLLAYSYFEDELILTFINHGTHENFYRDLKNC